MTCQTIELTILRQVHIQTQREYTNQVLEKEVKRNKRMTELTHGQEVVQTVVRDAITIDATEVLAKLIE